MAVSSDNISAFGSMVFDTLLSKAQKTKAIFLLQILHRTLGKSLRRKILS
jgi:hypothetical protein